MADAFKLDESIIEDLRAFAEDAKEAVLRSGGGAMTEVFQQEAKLHAPIYTEGRASHLTRTKAPVQPGQLRDSIYHARDESRDTDDAVFYEVSWNHVKAPHGWWMENGNSRIAAPHPFITPAWHSGKARAFEYAYGRMETRFKRLKKGGA